MGPIVKAVTETIKEFETSDHIIDSTWRCRLPDDIGDAHYSNTFIKRVDGQWFMRNEESL